MDGGGVLSHQELVKLIADQPPLVGRMPYPNEQVQPNGVDITVESVSRFLGAGRIGRSNAERVLPNTEELPFDEQGWLHLPAGAYQARFNEMVNLRPWLMAYARPRSSLLRSGVALHTAVWDAGYQGRGVALMVVYHPAGFDLQRDARICQLVFHTLNEAAAEGYSGTYQHEGR
jgi:dUTP pyrophosphatase